MANVSNVNPDVFAAYDVRGVYPSELNDETAYLIGRALVQFLRVPQVAIGRDMRVSSPALAQALMRGITEQGADAVELGLTTTDELYFAVGKFGYPAGVMITASHNPGNYNGLKFCREQAIPISSATGLEDIKQLVLAGRFEAASHTGRVIERDVLDEFVQHAFTFIDVAQIKPLKIAVDAGNGMAGMLIPRVFKHLPCTLVPLYFALDGTFPNHPASPIEPENTAELRRTVVAQHCDMGIAFDGDADRMFITDEKGDFVGGDMVTALVAQSILRRNPGATVLYNLICSRSVPEVIERNGGHAIRTRVGHSFIKAQMRQENAIFGGEHSGHFYFRDNWYADSGLIAFLIVLELVSESGKTVSQLLAPIDTRFRSGEINSKVGDQEAKMREVKAHYAALGAQIDELDGVTINFPTWWCNVRASNTEPLLRLNVEADTHAEMERRRDEVLAEIRR
ncbi:MAG TPA: phosphomannomutase/phosphoglucomutase [Ktedonobacterales bacterium]|jgi:phosphomannomutase|nr:phosphomannomutase/phosphoglucomutase [Ktedonobacterales bacterium]